MSEEMTQINIPNVPATLKERLEREAQAQDRSLASLLRTILTHYAKNLDTRRPELTDEGYEHLRRTGVFTTSAQVPLAE